MKPITAKVVNAMSMFDIFVHLHPINDESGSEKYAHTNCSHQKCVYGKFVRYKVANNCNSHNKFPYIIAILGEIVYLLFVYHVNVKRATDVPEAYE